MNYPADGGSGGGGSVTLSRAGLTSAQSKLADLASAFESGARRVVSGTPAPVPSLSGGRVEAVVQWMRDQDPNLQLLVDLVDLLDTEGGGIVSFSGTGSFPELKAMLGTEIAKRGQGYLDSEGEVEDAAAYADLLERYADDRIVSTAFLNTMGPEGVLDLNGRVLTMSDDAAVLQRLQQNLGRTLATGTENLTGPGDPGSTTRVSTEWLDQLVAAGRERRDIPGMVSEDGENQASAYGYQLLGPLLGEGTYSSYVLNRLGHDMVDFEKDYAKDHDGDLPWNQIMKPMNKVGISSHGAVYPNAPIRLDWTSGGGDKIALGSDPLGGLMEGFGNVPEAGREFFTSGGDVDGNPPNLPMVKYLLHDRDWPQETFVTGGNVTDPQKWPSGISHLGDALEAATTVRPNQESVSIVESIVHESHAGYDTDDPFSETDVVDPDVREDLGNILAKYMPSVHRAMGPDAELEPDTPDFLFDDAQLNLGGEDGKLPTQLLLADLAKDDDARDVLKTSSNAWMVDRLNHDLHGVTDPSDIEARTTATAGVNSSVLGAIDFGSSRDERHTQVTSDEKHNDMVDAYTDLASSLLGDIPKSGNVPLLGWFTDQATEGIKDSLHVDHTGDTNNTVGHLLGATKDDQSALIQTTIWHNIPDSQLPDGLSHHTDLDDMTPEQERSYSRWLNDRDNDWAQQLRSRMQESTSTYDAAYSGATSALEEFTKK